MKITFSEDEMMNFYDSADVFLLNFIKTIAETMDENDYDNIHQLIEDYDTFNWFNELVEMADIFRQFGIEIIEG